MFICHFLRKNTRRTLARKYMKRIAIVYSRGVLYERTRSVAFSYLYCCSVCREIRLFIYFFFFFFAKTRLRHDCIVGNVTCLFTIRDAFRDRRRKPIDKSTDVRRFVWRSAAKSSDDRFRLRRVAYKPAVFFFPPEQGGKHIVKAAKKRIKTF